MTSATLTPALIPAPRRAARPAAAPTPRAAVALLRQAAEGLAEAHRRPEPLMRYPAAYLAALRAGAAVLALARPPGATAPRQPQRLDAAGRRRPELGEWAAYFASCSATRAAAEAGIERLVSTRDCRRPAAPVRAVPGAGHRSGRRALARSRRSGGRGGPPRGGGGRNATPGPGAW